MTFNTWRISTGVQESSVVSRDCEVILILDASQSMKELDKQYGDVGVALTEAVALFSQEENEKRIVWIIDGELLLYSPKNTEISSRLPTYSEGNLQNVLYHAVA